MCMGQRIYAGAEQPSDVSIGFQERLGATVALDAALRGEDGTPLTLRQLIRTPTILALVYYNCPNVCDYLLIGIAGALKSLTADPGRDFQVITVSIDEQERPVDARRAKRIALESIEKPFPPSAWRFLTGSGASVRALADSVGFRFARRGEGSFDHPVGLVILSPEGRIVRYMPGADFLPADLRLSLLEASQGRVGPTIARLVRMCFSVEPEGHKIVFRTLQVVGAVTLSTAGLLVVYLVLAGRRRRRSGSGGQLT